MKPDKSVVITVYVIAMWEAGYSTDNTLSIIYKSLNWNCVLFCLWSVCFFGSGLMIKRVL